MERVSGGEGQRPGLGSGLGSGVGGGVTGETGASGSTGSPRTRDLLNWNICWGSCSL